MPRALLPLVLLAGGCTPAPPPAAPAPTPPAGWFADVTPASGLGVVYRNGEEADRLTILETLGGGCAAVDFDGDGRLDLLFTRGGEFAGPDKKHVRGFAPTLYRNLGGLKFQDVTVEAGLTALAGGADWFYTHGLAVADYDRDGRPDVLVTGYGRVALLRNEGGRFADVTAAVGLLGEHIWATGAAFADLDADGWPDLYVCNYCDWSNSNDPPCRGYAHGVARDVCSPKQFSSRPHRLFRNQGNGTFSDVTAASGVRFNRPDGDHGKGLGVLAADFDADGRPDLYVANDTSGNFLYLNRSDPGTVRLDERGMALGVARDGSGTATGSMGLDAGEFDGTGRPSVWVTNYESEYHALYRNKSSGDRLSFGFDSPAAGITALGTGFVGFGTAFLDVDRDGWEDLVVNNGHVVRHPARDNLRQRPVLLRNVPKGAGRAFADARTEAGPHFSGAFRGRGLAVADLDDDGRPEVVLCHLNEPAVLLRNDGPAARWLGVQLVGRDRRDVVGATVTLATPGRPLTRFACGGRSYLSHCDGRLLFGLGDAPAVGRLTVRWPSGEPRLEQFDGLAVDRYHRVEQGKGTP